MTDRLTEAQLGETVAALNISHARWLAGPHGVRPMSETLEEVLQRLVPHYRLEGAREAILSASDVVSREDHLAAVKREIEWGNHRFEQLTEAQREVSHLRTLVDLGEAARTVGALNICHAVPNPSKTATHNDECWTRHASCLAQRVLALWSK